MPDSINIFYTYIYYDPSRGNEPIYVGKGCGERAWKHLKRTNMHPFTQRLNLMKRNGVHPVIGLYSELDEEFAHFLEEELIANFGRKDLGKGTLLNLTNGGEGSIGLQVSKETRRKLSEAKLGKPGAKRGKKYGPQHTEESKLKISEANKKKILSDESKQKVREANLGKKLSEETKQKIRTALLIRSQKSRENSHV